MKLIIILISVFTFVPVGLCQYLDDISCGDGVPDSSDLAYVYYDNDFATEYYKKVDAKIKIGSQTFNKILYIYKNKKYYGKQVSISSQQKYNAVLRYLEKTHGRPYYAEKRAFAWVLEKEVIFLKRYSYYIGVVNIICRKQHEQMIGSELELPSQVETVD